MNKGKYTEERIAQEFQNFFEKNKGEEMRTPSSLKKYNASLYAVLRKEYKRSDWKIDRDTMLGQFVSKDKRKLFKHTNIYNEQGIKKEFTSFFKELKKQNKETWTVGDLKNRNESLVITIGKKYWRNDTGYVDREQFAFDYNLGEHGVLFVREVPKRTPITIDRMIKTIEKDLLKSWNKKRFPTTLHNKYLKWLGKRYRDENGKIDWLYIIYKVLSDSEINKKFTHRYYISRLLEPPKKIREKELLQPYHMKDKSEKNPEEELIEREENDYKENLLQGIYEIIEKNLSKEEQQELFNRMESEEKDTNTIDNILIKLRENI